MQPDDQRQTRTASGPSCSRACGIDADDSAYYKVADGDFDGYVEALCQRFYADEIGRPGLATGRYFRLLLIGSFEGVDAERAIAWRAADSFALRESLGLEVPEAPPDHSTMSRTRRLIDLETPEAIFTWILQRLVDEGLVNGKTIEIDATTLEANAPLRSRNVCALRMS